MIVLGFIIQMLPLKLFRYFFKISINQSLIQIRRNWKVKTQEQTGNCEGWR